MFDKNFNIISGERMSGRTGFLIELYKSLNNVGIKSFFLGCVNDSSYPKSSKDYRLLDTSDNIKMLEVVQEVTEEGYGYHFIIVDDIDYLSIDSIDFLSKINVRKIATCLNDNLKNIIDFNSVFYKIEDIFSNPEIASSESIIQSIIREQKINIILK